MSHGPVQERIADALGEVLCFLLCSPESFLVLVGLVALWFVVNWGRYWVQAVGLIWQHVRGDRPKE